MKLNLQNTESNLIDTLPNQSQFLMFVYWIKSGKKNYIGATKNIKKRIDQHNGKIKGGSSSTKGSVWKLHKTVTGFETWRDCLSFEIRVKHKLKRNQWKDVALIEFVESSLVII